MIYMIIMFQQATADSQQPAVAVRSPSHVAQ